MNIFLLIDCFNFLLLQQSDNELLLSEMQKKLGVTNFVSEIKRMENYSDFEKLDARNSAWSTGVYR